MPWSVVVFHSQLPCETKPVLMETDQIILQLTPGISQGTLLKLLLWMEVGCLMVWALAKAEGRGKRSGWG